MNNIEKLSLKKFKAKIIILISAIFYIGCSSIVNISGYSKDQLVNNPQKASYLEVSIPKGITVNNYGYNIKFCIAPAIYKDYVSFSSGSTAKVFCSIGDCYNTKTEECSDSYDTPFKKNRYIILKPGEYTLYARVDTTRFYSNGTAPAGSSIISIDKFKTESGNTTSIIFSPEDQVMFNVASTKLKYNIYIRKNTIYDINKKELVQLK